MRSLIILLFCLVTALTISPVSAAWELYEETNVKGSISGSIKKGSVIKMQSGSIYEVSELTIQLVLELSPEAIVLRDGDLFKLTIKGFDEPLVCKQLVPPAAVNISLQSGQNAKPATRDSVLKDIPLDTLMSPAQQRQMGIQKLTSDEKDRLRDYLATLYQQGIEQGKGNKAVFSISTVAQPTRPEAASAIESQVDGDFNGWEGETIVKLINGQIWQQTQYHYAYHYAYMPKVLIYHSGGGYKMKVDGIDESVGVTQLK